jgi:hypothetical protein
VTTCRIGRHGADLNRQVWDSTPCPTPCRARMPGSIPPVAATVHPWTRIEPRRRPPDFFVCGRCRVQVLICSCCDRGQIYCADGCAQEARQQAQRAAGQRYQVGWRGRVNHAARSSRWRARQKNVTHHRSPPPADDLVLVGAAVGASDRSMTTASDVAGQCQGLGARPWHYTSSSDRGCPGCAWIFALRRSSS